MKIPFLGHVLVIGFIGCLLLILSFCIYSYYGKNGVHTKEKQQCISEQALQGCEQTGFDVERQLRSCEWSLERCIQTNTEFKEKLKGERK